MITEQERNEIIAAAVEKTLLLIPETVGNLMASHAALHKINMEFYNKYPEFRDKKDVVASVVEMIEGKDPLVSYEDILKRAVPEIRTRIATMKTLDMQNVSPSPNRDMKALDVSPHGEI